MCELLLQDTPGASTREAMLLAASSPAEPTSAAAAPPASDPFTAAARSSFDAPWCAYLSFFNWMQWQRTYCHWEGLIFYS